MESALATIPHCSGASAREREGDRERESTLSLLKCISHSVELAIVCICVLHGGDVGPSDGGDHELRGGVALLGDLVVSKMLN